ncbi:hypothetical protein [Rhodococcus daqingensis]|uniref:Uncharacterized protein n=1 Tax=Rhodococcus daqingensis TaxID=2479363 RepID=A0ABW2S3B6_9NOCA
MADGDVDTLQIPDEATNHPVVIGTGVVVLVAVLIVVGGRKIAGLVAPGWEWWQGRHERRFQRQVRIEAAARMLNDERVGILLERIDGLHAELIAQREELTAQRDEERRRGDRLEHELGEVRAKLDHLASQSDPKEGA